MSTLHSTRRLFVPTLMTAAIVAACGGGGGGAPESTLPPGQNAPLPEAVPAEKGMTMSCADGAGYQCSGGELLRTENGVSLTRSGVFAYARSTSDLAPTNLEPTNPTGFETVSGGTAEVRIHRNASGDVDRAALVLRDLGIKWDGINERPPIIESFDPTEGITRLVGDVITSLPSRLPTDLTYYDFATGGVNATQENYANNRYFPRDQLTNPSRGCPSLPCPTVETTGVDYTPGPFRNGTGTDPDVTAANRGHSDGDIHAGNASNGQPFPPAPAPSVPYPGNKGFRNLVNYSYVHSNLGAWVSQDTVQVAEWSTGPEHATSRRGITAFGDTTAPADVPRGGEATYNGVVHGWYTPDGNTAATVVYKATARIVVNFATRQVAISVTGAVDEAAPSVTVPVTIDSRAAFGADGSNVANYLTGAVTAGGMSGGVGGRFFGPAAAEIAGTFTFKDATTRAATVGGFIARR